MGLFNWIKQVSYEYDEEMRKKYNPTPYEKWKQILNDITNYSIEKDAIEKLKSSSDARESMLYIIADDLREVFGEEWKTIYEHYNQASYDASFSQSQELITAWDVAFHIWFAKNGYIPSYWESREYKYKTIPYKDEMLGGCRRHPVIVSTCKIIQKYMQAKYPAYKEYLVIYSCPDYCKLKWKSDIIGLGLPRYGAISPYPIY